MFNNFIISGQSCVNAMTISVSITTSIRFYRQGCPTNPFSEAPSKQKIRHPKDTSLHHIDRQSELIVSMFVLFILGIISYIAIRIMTCFVNQALRLAWKDFHACQNGQNSLNQFYNSRLKRNAAEKEMPQRPSMDYFRKNLLQHPGLR